MIFFYLELELFKEKIKDNQDKTDLNMQLPYFVGNIVGGSNLFFIF